MGGGGEFATTDLLICALITSENDSEKCAVTVGDGAVGPPKCFVAVPSPFLFSPSFAIPLDSKESEANIANFFASAQQKKQTAVKPERAEEPSAAVGEDDSNKAVVDDVSKGKRKAAPAPGGSLPLKKPPGEQEDKLDQGRAQKPRQAQGAWGSEDY